MEKELLTLRERNRVLEGKESRNDEKEENSDYEHIRELFRRVDEEKLQEDKNPIHTFSPPHAFVNGSPFHLCPFPKLFHFHKCFL